MSTTTAPQNGSGNKRKRRPAGTPDPDAEVVSLSPNTLMESDSYVCEICNQGFHRDQNLQMHRRRHKLPWRLLKRHDASPPRKRVFVCPEPSCLHHDPCHALGDLVGIKKHFRRKHSDRRQWVCGKCSKGYAVQSDYKAHQKTCGTRGHSCDCGRVFSRVESFIEHQDACTTMRHLRSPPPSLTTSCATLSSDTILATAAPVNPIFSGARNCTSRKPELGLQLLTKDTAAAGDSSTRSTQLQLCIGLPELGDPKTEADSASAVSTGGEISHAAAREKLRVAMAEKERAEEAREKVRRQVEKAERELVDVKRFRRAAQVELERAEKMKEQAARQMSSTIMELCCHACRQHKLRGLLQC